MTYTDHTLAAAPKNKAAIGTYVLCFNLLFDLRFLGVVRFVTRGGKKHIANQKLHQGSIKNGLPPRSPSIFCVAFIASLGHFGRFVTGELKTL
jgi:hypothetical protein